MGRAQVSHTLPQFPHTVPGRGTVLVRQKAGSDLRRSLLVYTELSAQVAPGRKGDGILWVLPKGFLHGRSLTRTVA